MAFEFRLPDIGEGVVEGEVVKWHVREGDTLAEDQPMVEVMTDKATVEIPSPKAGRVDKILAAEGKMCAVGAVMVVIDDAGKQDGRQPVMGNRQTQSVAAETPTASAPAVVQAIAQASVSAPGGKVLATPATRKMARDLGVDLTQVAPTGKNGRITRDDVAAHGSNGNGHHAPVMERRAPPPLPPVDAVDERVAFRGVRKKIAENMHRSRQTAAHFTYVEECDMTELVALRARLKGRRAGEREVKISYLPFIIKACCTALKRYPIVNAMLDDAKQEIVLRKRYHIGVAAATAEGLTVPVIKDADQKSIFELARLLDDLSEKARAGKASRDELTGSTFTISSLGSLGGVLATPIINHPEVAILGVHKIKETPAVRDGQIVIRHMMNLSISLDHRVVDGYEGAQFLQTVIELLEDPTLMFMDMV